MKSLSMKTHSEIALSRLLIIAILWALGCATSNAQQTSRLQALYLFNFAKNTSWSASDADKPLTLVVVGDKAVAKDLKAISKNKQVGGRPVEIAEMASAQGIQGADIVFLGGAKSAQIETLVSEQAANKVLIVSATEGQCAKGACIAFELNKGKFTYTISEANIKSHGLSVSRVLITSGKAL